MAEKRKCRRCGSGKDVRRCRRNRFAGSFTDYCKSCRARYQEEVELDEPKSEPEAEPEPTPDSPPAKEEEAADGSADEPATPQGGSPDEVEKAAPKARRRRKKAAPKKAAPKKAEA